MITLHTEKTPDFLGCKETWFEKRFDGKRELFDGLPFIVIWIESIGDHK